MYTLELQGKREDYYLTDEDKAKVSSVVYIEHIDKMYEIMKDCGSICREQALLDLLVFGVMNDIIKQFPEKLRFMIMRHRTLTKSLPQLLKDIESVKEWIIRNRNNIIFESCPKKIRMFYYIGGMSPKKWCYEPLFTEGVTLMTPHKFYYSIYPRIDLSKVKIEDPSSKYSSEEIKSLIY